MKAKITKASSLEIQNCSKIVFPSPSFVIQLSLCSELHYCWTFSLSQFFSLLFSSFYLCHCHRLLLFSSIPVTLSASTSNQMSVCLSLFFFDSQFISHSATASKNFYCIYTSLTFPLYHPRFCSLSLKFFHCFFFHMSFFLFVILSIVLSSVLSAFLCAVQSDFLSVYHLTYQSDSQYVCLLCIHLSIFSSVFLYDYLSICSYLVYLFISLYSFLLYISTVHKFSLK